MNDYRNNSFKPDVESFKVKIADDDFASAADTMKSVTGGERISYKPGDINKTERSDFYADDQRERMERKEHKKRDKIKAHKNKVIFRADYINSNFFLYLTDCTLQTCFTFQH